ncbi:MAG: hypothetical protein JWR10_1098 [Rubritepida sp.]|nr:hypothetical protein [Rubritepida sp.]
MLVKRRRAVLGTAILPLAAPALAQDRFDFGAFWRIEERSRTACGTGIWTRQGTSSSFGVNWTEKASQ